MAIESTVEPGEGFVRVTNVGVASAASLREMTDRLVAHPLITPGSRVLVDNRGIDYSQLSASDIQERSKELNARGDLDTFQIAIVVETVADFGSQRMTALISGDSFPNARGFTSIDDAIAWLQSD